MNKFIWTVLLLIGAYPQLLAQTFTFSNTEGLAVDVVVINECDGSEDGSVQFTLTNVASPDVSATLISFFGDNFSEIVSGIELPLNTPVVITGSESPPGLPADIYDFVILPNNSGALGGQVEVFNINEPTITVNTPPTDLENDDPTCTVLDAQINVTLSGGSLPLAGGGNLNYQITSDNPIPGTSGDTQSLGTTTLDFATLLNGGSPLPGGTYTLTVTDAFSTCGTVVYQATVDDQAPTAFTISTAADSVCENQDIVITVDQTEENVSYEIFVEGTPTGLTGIGPGGASVGDAIDITIPSTFGYTSLDSISVLASLGLCTSIFMNDTLTVRVDPEPNPNLPVVAAQAQICSGDGGIIQVQNSQTGVRYQLRNSANAPIGTFVVGNNGTINLPTGALTTDSTFNVTATNGACTPIQLVNTATITVDTLPDSTLSVTPQDNTICEGNATTIRVANPEVGYRYELRNDADNSTVGIALLGVGDTLFFPTGILTTTTTFNVLVENGTCSVELLQLATVNVDPEPDPTLNVFAAADSLCAQGTTVVSVENTQPGVTYSLRIGTTVIGTSQIGNNGQRNFPTGPLSSDVTFNILAGRGTCQVQLDSTASVRVNPRPPDATNPTGSAFCAVDPPGSPVIPAISVDDPGAGFRVDWYDAASGGNLVDNGASITPDSAGTFYAEIVNTTTLCVSVNRVAATVTENPRPTATVTLDGSSTVCSNDSTNVIFTFNATTPLDLNFIYQAGSNVFFVNNYDSIAFVIPNAQSGDYFIQILSDANTSCVANAEDRGDTVTVTVIPAPTVNDLTPSVCEDAAGSGQATVDLTALQASINANAGLTFNWYSDSTLMTLVPDPANALVTLPDSVFFAEVDDGTCSAVARVDYTIESLPEANNLTLMVCEDNFGSDQVNVNLVDLQDSIDGGAGHTITWFSDSLVTLVPDPANVLVTSTANQFFALVDNLTCTAVARVDYTVNGLPVNAVNPRDSSYCEGSALVSISVDDPGTGFRVDWYDAAVGGNFAGSGATFTPSAPGDYFAEIVNTTSNCTSVARVEVTLTEIPAPAANNLSLEVCEDNFGSGQALVNLEDLQDSIDGGAGHTFTWFSDSLITLVPDPTNVVVTTTNNQFFAQVSDTSACEAVVRVDYRINSLPLDATTTADSVSYCAGSAVPSIGVDAPGPDQVIEWFDALTGGTLVANGTSFIPSAPGQYFAQVVDTITSCVSENRLAVTLLEIPLPTAVINDGGAVCPGDPLPDVTFTFTGIPPFDFTFSNGATLQNVLNHPDTFFVINNAAVGTYRVTALSDSTTCNATVLGDSVVVELSPVPTPTFQMPDSIVCFGDTIVYTTQPAQVNYAWSVTGGDVVTGGGVNDSTLSVAWNGVAPYEIRINYEDTTGCTAASPTVLSITVNPLPGVFNVTGTATICAGDSTLIGLDGSENDIRYDLFRDGVLVDSVAGDGNPIVFSAVGTAGTYTVAAQDTTTTCGTVMTGSAVVTVTPVPGDPTVFGNDTWIGYVFDESGNGPLPDSVLFAAADYRGFITETEIDTYNGQSFYNTTTDEFDLNIGGGSLSGANICGSYADSLSVRFRMRKNFARGEYTFAIGSNDGRRFYVDGALILDDFVNQAFDTDTISLCLEGNQELVLDYYENTSLSRVSFTYTFTPAPSVSLSVDQPTACRGDEVVFTAVPSNAGTNPFYEWFIDSTLVSDGLNPEFRTSLLEDGDSVFVRLIPSGLTCFPADTAVSNVIVMGIDTALVASVSIQAIPNPVCVSDTIRFTASPQDAGASPTFQWRINGVDAPGETGTTFATAGLADSTLVNVVMTPDTAASCIVNSIVVSDTIAARVVTSLTASVTITGPNAICAGDTATFSASAIEAGASPTYQWRINGVDVAGETGTSFIATGLNDLDDIDVILTPDSTSTCITNSSDTSNIIEIRVGSNLVTSVNISASDTTICPGDSVTFTATPVNGGPSPTFQWRVNGVDVAGATDSTFITTSLNALDSVLVEMTADTTGTACITGGTVLSNTIGINAIDLLIVQDPPQGVCPGDSVEIIASGFDTYEFIDVATAQVLQSNSADSTYSDIFDIGQAIAVVASSASCGAVSDTIVVDIRPVLSLSQSPDPGLCLGDSISIEATEGYDTYTFRDIALNLVLQSGGSNVFVSTGLSNGQAVEVEASSTACGTVLDTLEVDINLQVVLLQDSLTTSCPGDSVRLFATPGFDNYEFRDGIGGPVLQDSADSIYFATDLSNGQIIEVLASSSTCGTALDSIVVNLVPVLTIDQSPNPGLCSADSISIIAKTGFSFYVFRDIATDTVMQFGTLNTFVSTGFSDGQAVEVTGVSTTCGNITDTLEVNVNPVFEVLLLQDSLTTSCPGDSVRLFATPGFDNYEFRDGIGGPVLQDSADSIYFSTSFVNGQIIEVFASSSTCGTTSDSVVVNLVPVLTLDQSPDPGLCSGDSISIIAKPGFDSYIFRDIATNTLMQSDTLNVFVSTGFFDGQAVEVTANSTSCGNVADTLVLNVNTLDVLLLQDSLTTSCPGDSVRLFATPGFDSYEFFDVLTNVSLQDSADSIYFSTNFADGQLIRVVASSPVCGDFADTLSVDLDPFLSLAQSPNPGLCPGDTVSIEATQGYTSYIFRDIGSNTVLQSDTSRVFRSVSFSAGQQIEVTANSSSCGTAVDTLTVNLRPLLALSQDPPGGACPGDSTTLIATPGYDSYVFRNFIGGGVLRPASADSTFTSPNFVNGQLVLVEATSATCRDTTAIISVNVLPGTAPGCGGVVPICTAVDTLTVAPGSIVRPNCGSANGSFVINAAFNASAPTPVIYGITYFDSDSGRFVSQSQAGNPLFDSLASRQYRYFVTDGVTDTCALDFFLPSEVTVDARLVAGTEEGVSCFGELGSAIITVSNVSTPVYSITRGEPWLSLGGMGRIPNLPAGTTTVLVGAVPNDPCPAEIEITIPSFFEEIQADIERNNVTDCGNNDGSLVVDFPPMGGAGDAQNGDWEISLEVLDEFFLRQVVEDFGPFTSERTFDDLQEGNYIITLRDSIGCEREFDNLMINSPNQVDFDLDTLSASCDNLGRNGALIFEVTNGRSVPGPYVLIVTRGDDETNIIYQDNDYNGSRIEMDTLASGIYNVTIDPADNQFCPMKKTATITGGPEEVSFDFELVCIDDDNIPELRLFDIRGEEGAPFTLNVYQNGQLFGDAIPVPIDTRIADEFIVENRLFLNSANSVFRLELVQTQSVCPAPISFIDPDPSAVLQIPADLLGEIGEVTLSLPERPTGELAVNNINGGRGPYVTFLELTVPNPTSLIFDYEVGPDTVSINNTTGRFDQRYTGVPAGDLLLTIQDAIGCIHTIDYTVPIDQSIFIPNVFTPNGDDANERFEVRNLKVGASTERAILVITNRWGNVVYESRDYNNDWNAEGTPDGVYFYKLQARGEVFSGWVEIIRGQP